MAPSVDWSSSIIVTKEGSNISLSCNVSGKPEPSISWTRIGSSDVLSVSPSLTVVNVSRPGTADKMIQYQCTASNGVETPATATVNVTVECKWKLQWRGKFVDLKWKMWLQMSIWFLCKTSDLECISKHSKILYSYIYLQGWLLGRGIGCAPLPLEMTCGFLL